MDTITTYRLALLAAATAALADLQTAAGIEVTEAPGVEHVTLQGTTIVNEVQS